MLRLMTVVLCALALAGCSSESAPPTPDGRADGPAPDRAADRASPPKEAGAQLALSSSAIAEGQPIDKKHTCDGADASPPLAWSGAPAGTASWALVVDDPDAPAGVFSHWVLWALAANRSSLPEGVAREAEPAGIGRQGKNGFGKIGYNGPCPPAGKLHHYRFKLYALSSTVDLPAGTTTSAELEAAVAGKTLAQSTLTGTYSR
jgi:Raf kinase inhibitor-like YbhB/YbcL family protein